MKPKYIRVLSDLHLEQLLGQREEFLALSYVPPDPRDSESILVLAGDISSKPQQLIPFLGWLKDRFIKVIYVPGNHEYYGHEIHSLTQKMFESIDGPDFDGKIEYAGTGVGLLEFDGLRFIHTTLWGDGGSTLAEHADVGKCLNDFRVVELGDKRFTVADMKTLHKTQKRMLRELLETPFDGKTVVVTHHMPSYQLCHPRFGTDINGGFASHSDDLMGGEFAPAVWIHGHTHDSIDRKLHQCRVVCNPSGYRYEYGGVHNTFGPKFLSIENMQHVEPVKPMWHSTPADHLSE